MNATSTAHPLVRGEFDPKDAQDIITTLIQGKINFHHRKDFSSQVKKGCDDDYCRQRIKELQDSQDQMVQLIRNAAEQGKQVRISTVIHMEMV